MIITGRNLAIFLFFALGVNGQSYGDWSDWSVCSVQCAGVGLQKRTRECLRGPCLHGDTVQYRKCDRQGVTCEWEDDEVCSMMNQLILDNVFHVKSVVVVVVLKRRPLCLGTIIERKRVLVPDGCLPTSANDLAKIRMFRLDDPGNPVSIYATSSLDPYPFVLIMASKSFFGDIRNFNDGHMDYETYLRRHWERESELPRLSYMSHKKLVEACGYMVSFRKQNFHLTSFRFKLVKNWSRSVKEGCGGVLLRQGQICAAAHVDFEIKRRWLKGSPVLVNLGGRVFTVGLAVHEANFKKSPLSIITINSIYDAYQNIGCNELLFGYETPWRDVSNPTSADLSTCDCETWWDDQKACAFEPPLCISQPELSPDVNQLTNRMPSDCPTEQQVNTSPITGFKCIHGWQTSIGVNRCYCHNYQISYKCPYVLI